MALLLRAIIEGPDWTREQFAEAAGVEGRLLWVNYPSERTPETIAKIARGAARLLDHSADQLLAFLQGTSDPELELYLQQLPELVRCVHCQPPRLVHRDDYVPATGRCRRCHREKKNPKAANFRQALVLSLPILKTEDPDLHAACVRVLAHPTMAITGPNIARASRGKVSAEEFAERLRRHTGLSKRADDIDWDWLMDMARRYAVFAAIMRALMGPAPAQADSLTTQPSRGNPPAEAATTGGDARAARRRKKSAGASSLSAQDADQPHSLIAPSPAPARRVPRTPSKNPRTRSACSPSTRTSAISYAGAYESASAGSWS